jgi:hypothetical protein
MREVLERRPFAVKFGDVGRVWEEIADKLRALQLDVSAKTVKGRCLRLKRLFKKEQMDQLRKSGTEDEYCERERLLQDYIELEPAAEHESGVERAKKAALERAREDQGMQVRGAATMGHRPRDIDSTLQSESEATPAGKRMKQSPAVSLMSLKEEAMRAEAEERRTLRNDTRVQKDAELELRRHELKQQRIDRKAERKLRLLELEQRTADRELRMHELEMQTSA